MKAMNIMLCLIIALLGGFITYSLQSGLLVLQPDPEVVEEDAAPEPIISTQVELVDELMLALESAQADVDTKMRELDKREADLNERHAVYVQLRNEVNSLMTQLEDRMVEVSESDRNSAKQMAGVYSKMDPGSAAQAFRNMTNERVALVLSQMDSRSMAALLDAAVKTGADGGEYVAEWTDALRRIEEDKGAE